MTLAKEHARFLSSMFITILTSQATMVADAAIGGNLLGADAVPAVDLVMPVYELFYALVTMLGMGGCTVASMCLGRGDVVAVRRHFTAAVVSSLLVMTLISIGIVVFQDRIVGVLCRDSYLHVLTRRYLVSMAPYFVFAGLTTVFMIFTSMAGRPLLMMKSAVVQFVMNVSFNLLLIKVAGLGIEALAYSSLLSCVVSLLILLPYYFSEDCPFRMLNPGVKEFFVALGANVRYGVGFLVVNMSYMFMVYSMNSMVLKDSGEQGLFFWSVVLMIYLTGDYASSAAQETSLMLGGRLFAAGKKADARMVYNRSLLFAMGWILLVLVSMFAFPNLILPLFGAAESDVYPQLLKVIACAAPFIAGIILGNMLLIRLLQRGKVVQYMVLSCLMYLVVPLGYRIL